MKSPFIVLLLLSFLSAPATSFAWGADGHQSVGAIAENMLAGSKAGQKIKSILPGNSLEQMSVWGDCVKGVAPEKDFSYTSAGKYPECASFENAAGIAEMVDYVKRNHTNCNPAFDEEVCHKQYHYTNIAIQHDHYKTGLVGTSDHDLINAIRAAILVLQGKPQAKPFQFKDQREALALLTHYVGDIHQPLHSGSIFLNADGKEINPDEGEYDRGTTTVGGNALQGPCGNLHALWDDVPQQFKRGRMNEALTKKAKLVAKSKDAIEQWPTIWANESIMNARLVYAGTQFSKSMPNQRGNSWSIALPLEYEKTMLTMKEDALIKGGAHLAQLLQAIWSD